MISTYIVWLVDRWSRCLSAIPHVVRYHVHLRLLVVDGAQNATLASGFVGIGCRQLRPFRLAHVLGDLCLAILTILPTPLLLVVVMALFRPIAHHVVCLGPRCVDLLLLVDFDQLLGLVRKLLLREQRNVVKLFLKFNAKEFGLFPVVNWNLIHIVIWFDLGE